MTVSSKPQARTATSSGSSYSNYPLALAVVFLITSLTLYWIRFPAERSAFVALYVATCILALSLGSKLGSTGSHTHVDPAPLKLGWLRLACLVLVLVSTVNISVYYTSLTEIATFVLEPGAAYERVKLMTRSGNTTEGIVSGPASIVVTALTFTKYVVFGWSALYWKRLPVGTKILCVVSMAYFALHAALIGAMVNIAGVLITALAMVMIARRADLQRRGTKLLRASVVPAILGLLIMSYFLGSRDEGSRGTLSRLSTGFEGLSFYVSHGYVGLGYAVDQPFAFTGGRTIFYGISRVLSGEVPAESYPARTEAATGWSATQLWSTAAPWLASDITFWGVPILLLLLGIWMSRLWSECCATLDPYASLVYAQLCLGVFFFPSNNHLFHTFANATAFFIIFVAWRITRRSRRKKATQPRRLQEELTRPSARPESRPLTAPHGRKDAHHEIQ